MKQSVTAAFALNGMRGRTLLVIHLKAVEPRNQYPRGAA
jgi:hypothetical protein